MQCLEALNNVNSFSQPDASCQTIDIKHAWSIDLVSEYKLFLYGDNDLLC